MAERSLKLGIDASGAKVGADEYARAIATIRAHNQQAVEGTRALEQAQADLSAAFRDTAQASNPQTLGSTSPQLQIHQQTQALYDLEGAYGRTADQADTLEDVHLRLALALDREKLESQKLASGVDDLGETAKNAAGGLEDVGRKSVSMSKSIGGAIDSALGLDHAFGKVIRGGVYFLGADLVARAFGFQGALDAVSKGLDAVGQEVAKTGAAFVEWLNPGFAEAKKQAEELEERLKKLNEERDALQRDKFISIGDRKIDVEAINEDPELRKQLDFARGKAEELKKVFEDARRAAVNSARTGISTGEYARTLREGIAGADLAREARLKATNATDEEIKAVTGLNRVYKNEQEVIDALLAFERELTAERQKRKELDSQQPVGSGAPRQLAIPEQAEQYDTSSFDAFNAKVQAGLDARAEKERLLALAIDEQADADAAALAVGQRSYNADLLAADSKSRAAVAAFEYSEALQDLHGNLQSIGPAHYGAIQGVVALTRALTERIAAGQKAFEQGPQRILADFEFQASLIGKTAEEQERLTALRNFDAEALEAQAAALQLNADGMTSVDRQLAQARARLENALDEAEIARKAEDIAHAFADPIAQGVEAWIIGLASLEDAVENTARSIIASLVRINLTQPLQQGLLNLFNPGASAVYGPPAPSYMGNVVSGGHIIPHAYGGIPDIGNQQAFFPMSGGRTGSLREGGRTEAIMPVIARAPTGELGVKLVGGQPGGNVTNVRNFNIKIDLSSPGDERSRRQLVDDLNRIGRGE